MEVIGFSAAEFPLVTFSGQKRRKIKKSLFVTFVLMDFFLMDISFLRVLMFDGTASQLFSQMCFTNLIHQLYF